MENIEYNNNSKEISSYEEVVEKIKKLQWETLNREDLQQLMYLSYTSACEFAEALRIALQLYPNNDRLKQMADGELQTDNLKYEDYKSKGDHSEYLKHFIEKYNIKPNPEVEKSALAYQEFCSKLNNDIRAMTIFSREEKLPDIFKRILTAPDWSTNGLAAFKYYLEEHINLDTQEGGHYDLIKDLNIDDSVKSFYEARLEMYYSIKNLSKNRE